jgi:2-C-methyl-D-erythritol 4-phosphate cytidylyltransferase
VAGGSGRRFGAPKQFLSFAGQPLVSRSVDAARSVADGVVVVVPSVGADPGTEWKLDADLVVTGGSTRAASVRAGLGAVPEDTAIVVVHDAVRPLAQPSLFEAVVAAVREGADGAVPAVRVGDTLKQARDGVVRGTVDRSELVAVQTPQAFVADVLRRAHAGSPEATDDAALLEGTDAVVRIVDGDPRNLKITHPADLDVAEALFEVMSRDPRRG